MSWKDTPVCGCHAPRDGQEFSGRTLYAPACRRAPARPCRCPTTHVLLARRAHTHTQCLPMSMPHHPCASRPPHTHSACPPPIPNNTHVLLAMRPAHVFLPAAETLPAHGDPQQHVPLARAPARANRRPAWQARRIVHRHEWHDTARQKREHRTRWYRKEARVARHRTAKTRASHALASKVSPTHATTRYGFGSTSARRNARGARHAGMGHAAFDREVCSGAKLGEVTWRGVSGMGSLYLDR